VNERTKIYNETRKNHKNDLHIRGTKFGYDGKVTDQSYEAERKY